MGGGVPQPRADLPPQGRTSCSVAGSAHASSSPRSDPHAGQVYAYVVEYGDSLAQSVHEAMPTAPRSVRSAPRSRAVPSDGHLRPHRFAQRVTRRRTPAHGQGVHQEQPSARLALRSRRRRGRGWPFRRGRVRDLDANQACRPVESESEAEVPSGHTAVPHGVRGEFGDDEGDRARRVRLRRIPPLLHAPYGEPPGQSRTSWRRRELCDKRRQFALCVGEGTTPRFIRRDGRFCQHGVFRPSPSSREMSHDVREPSRSALQSRPTALRSTGDAALLFDP